MCKSLFKFYMIFCFYIHDSRYYIFYDIKLQFYLNETLTNTYPLMLNLS